MFAPDNVRAAARALFTRSRAPGTPTNRIRCAAGGARAARRVGAPARRLPAPRLAQPCGAARHAERRVRRPRAQGRRRTDRVVVRIEAKLRDYVVDRYGRHIKRAGPAHRDVSMREFWTLSDAATTGSCSRSSRAPRARTRSRSDRRHPVGRRAGHPGTRRSSSSAVADAVPAGTKIAEVADLEFDGDARAAANDLSLADGRFAPDVLEVAARRAVAAWAQAIDGNDDELQAIATRRRPANCSTPATRAARPGWWSAGRRWTDPDRGLDAAASRRR